MKSLNQARLSHTEPLQQAENSANKNQASLIYSIVPPALLSIITILMYLPSLWYPFQFDDLANIAKNYTVRLDNLFTAWWHHAHWLTTFINTTTFHFAHFNPLHYRSVNLIMHCLAGILLFSLILRLCRLLNKNSFFHEHALLLATTTSGLFLLHPVQTQTVSYVIQGRPEELATLLVLAALSLFVQGATSNNSNIQKLFYGLFFFTSLVACGTRETIIVLPMLTLLIDWFFISQQSTSALRQRLWLHITYALYFFALIAHYFGAALLNSIINSPLAAVDANSLAYLTHERVSWGQFFISQWRIIIHYLWMFIWPFNLSVEYDWKPATGILSPAVLISGIILTGLMWYASRSAKKRTHLASSFGLLWFFICIAPHAICIASPDLACDYKTYLASTGLFFLFATPLTWLLVQMHTLLTIKPNWFKNFESYRYIGRPGALMALAMILLMPLGFGARARNYIWQSALSFWQDTVQKAPLKARAFNNFGVALADAKRLDEAINAYQKAIELDDKYHDALSNLAVAYSLKGNYDQAIEALQKALVINPNLAEVHNNLGSLLIEKNELEKAETSFKKALELRPNYGKANYNLARIYERKKDIKKSWSFLKQATSSELTHSPELWVKFGHTSIANNQPQDAITAFKRAIRMGVNNPDVWFNLANSFYFAEKFDDAQVIYEKLVKDHPFQTKFMYNLAETLYAKKDYQRALALYNRTNSLPQSVPQSLLRVANCFEKLNKINEAKTFLTKILDLKNAPEDFTKVVKNEITRLSLQEKLHEGNGSIKLSDMKKVLNGTHEDVKKA